MSDSGAVTETREKIQRWVADDLGGIEVNRDGGMTFRAGSSRVWIKVHPLGEDGEETAVEIYSFVLTGVSPSAEFYEWVARSMTTYRFGTFFVIDSSEDDGTVDLLFRTTLLGTYIDPPELEVAYQSVAFTADKADDELQERFGGERFHEDE